MRTPPEDRHSPAKRDTEVTRHTGADPGAHTVSTLSTTGRVINITMPTSVTGKGIQPMCR
jgi:hypothetical protein